MILNEFFNLPQVFEKNTAVEHDSEYNDEAGMAETNLHTIARAAQGLLDTIDDRENLPEWVQEKIAKVEGMMVSAWDYLESQEEQGIGEGAEVDTGVVISKLQDIVADQEDAIQNADFEKQRQYATVVRDRASKALDMIKSGTDAASAYKYFQTGQQGVAEMDGDGAGRDGSNRKRISSYGNRDRDIPGPDAHLGSDSMMASKDMQDRALDKLTKMLSDPENMNVLKRLKTKEGVAEGSEDKIKQLKQDYATAVHWSKNDTNPHKREAARLKAEKIKAHLEKQYKQGVAEGKDDYVPPKEADYGDKYQAMVKRVGEKAKQQEKARQQAKTPVRESRRDLLKQIIQS